MSCRAVRRTPVIRRGLSLLSAAVLLPATLWAQRPTLGATLTVVADGGEGVEHKCGQSDYPLGLGARVGLPALTAWTSLQVNLRGYGISSGGNCATTEGPSPPDGTFLEDRRINLLSRSFVTTDVRLAAQLGRKSSLSLALGVGNAWHEGDNLPYGVVGAELALTSRPTYEISLSGELQMLRVTSDRFALTYQNFDLVSEVSLGKAHRWSHALVLGLSASGRL